MIITRVQAEEASVLRAFAERTFRIAYEATNDPHDFNEYCKKAFSLERVDAELSHPHSTFWFAYLETELVAYIKINFDKHPVELNSEKCVHVERIYVDPAFQGRRIGEKMLDFTLEQAKNAGAEWLWLGVWQANPAAVRFYERCGFQTFGTEIFVIGADEQVDWLMKKPVNSTGL